jgi:hypothetical protein
MADKTYVVQFKRPNPVLHLVAASTVEIEDEHLVFLNSNGKVAALFLRELVGSLSALPE